VICDLCKRDIRDRVFLRHLKWHARVDARRTKVLARLLLKWSEEK